MKEGKLWGAAFSTQGAPVMIAGAKQASQWSGTTSTGGKESAFDRLVDELDERTVQFVTIEKPGDDRALFVDTDGGGSTLVCAAPDAAWIVVAVCTSEDGDPPAVRDLQGYAEKSKPKGKSVGTLHVESGLTVADSAFSAQQLAKKAGGTELVEMIQSAPGKNGAFGKGGSACGAYVGAASGEYLTKVAEDVEIMENSYTVVWLTRAK